MAILPSQLAFYNSLIRIHHIITRGIEVTHSHSLNFAEKGFPDKNTQIGFGRYAYSLMVVLESHHQIEDETAFPYFQQRLPSLRIEPIIEQHKQMRPHINSMKAAIERIQSSTLVPADTLNQLAQASGNLHILWKMHAPAEENYFANNSLSALELTYEEQLEITRRTTEKSQNQSNMPQWVVAFILYNLPPEERALMAQSMPAQVTKVLVPMVWKNEWAPMKPFLLN
jgi:hypothetical protein